MGDCSGLTFACNITSLFNASCNNSSNSSGCNGVPVRSFVAEWSVLKLIQICCYILIAIVGSLGNILTIIVLLKPQNRSKTSSILLLNLAVCDVCIAAIGIPLDLGELVPSNWYYGKEMCNFIYPFQTSLPVVSSWTLLFMLAERNMIFSKHITTGLRARAVRLLAIITWILPLALVVPYGMKLSLAPGEGPGSVVCQENWSRPVDRQIYTVALFVTEYLVPIVVITLFVANIGSYLRKERKSVRKNALGLDKRTSKRRLRTNIRLTMIFIVIVTLYAALKLPNNVFWLWVEFGGGGESPHFNAIWTSVGLCSYATSMTNPFVLGAMSADFRKEFIKILSCRICICCKRKAAASFSPFSSTTIVSYKRINKIYKVATDQSVNVKQVPLKSPPLATLNGKVKPAQSPNWKKPAAIGRNAGRRKTMKYKYSDLLPESGPDSPVNSPHESNSLFENAKPLIDVETSQQGSDQIHIVCIIPDNQRSVSQSTVDDGGPHDTTATSSSESQSHQSLCVFLPEEDGEFQPEEETREELQENPQTSDCCSIKSECSKTNYKTQGEGIFNASPCRSRHPDSLQKEKQTNNLNNSKRHSEARILHGNGVTGKLKPKTSMQCNIANSSLPRRRQKADKKLLHERGSSEDGLAYSRPCCGMDSSNESNKQSNSYPNLDIKACNLYHKDVDINDNVTRVAAHQRRQCTKSVSLSRRGSDELRTPNAQSHYS